MNKTNLLFQFLIGLTLSLGCSDPDVTGGDAGARSDGSDHGDVHMRPDGSTSGDASTSSPALWNGTFGAMQVYPSNCYGSCDFGAGGDLVATGHYVAPDVSDIDIYREVDSKLVIERTIEKDESGGYATAVIEVAEDGKSFVMFRDDQLTLHREKDGAWQVVHTHDTSAIGVSHNEGYGWYYTGQFVAKGTSKGAHVWRVENDKLVYDGNVGSILSLDGFFTELAVRENQLALIGGGVRVVTLSGGSWRLAQTIEFGDRYYGALGFVGNDHLFAVDSYLDATKPGEVVLFARGADGLFSEVDSLPYPIEDSPLFSVRAASGARFGAFIHRDSFSDAGYFGVSAKDSKLTLIPLSADPRFRPSDVRVSNEGIVTSMVYQGLSGDKMVYFPIAD